MSKKLARGKFLKVAGFGVAASAIFAFSLEQFDEQTRRRAGAILNTTAASASKPVLSFRSRSDLRPTAVEVVKRSRSAEPGYVFIAPQRKSAGQHGPMIVGNDGQLVWFRPMDKKANNFRVQHYQGKPVLTWWEGEIIGGHGLGEYVILDSSYLEITRVRAGNGYQGDLHEFLITPQKTALFTVYHPVQRDLSSIGGSRNGIVVDGIAQEVDIESGRVLFEWHSIDHVGLEESYVKKPPKDPKEHYDYFHINSIDIDHDNNLLISGRKTWALYKVDRRSGDVMWRLGGKKSDFEMGPGARTAYQHDARRQPDGTITIFDNGAAPKVHNQSRGVVIGLDMDRMRARLVRQYTHPGKKLLANYEGSVQVLPDGNVFIGWGYEPFFSEFSPDGKLLYDARFPHQGRSYRAYRFPWSGHPTNKPSVAAESRDGSRVILYASWNGATEIATWQVLAGPNPGRLRSLGSAPIKGFETVIMVRTPEPYIAVRARDRKGRVLGTSQAIRPKDRS